MLNFNKKAFSLLLEEAIGDRSIAEFSRQSGVNRTYVSKLLNKNLNNPPSPEILKKLANSAYNNITYINLMQAAGYICLDEDDKSYKNNEDNNAVDTRKKLDEIIDDYLVKNELSLREFAQKCDLSHSYIATLRNGIDPRNNKEIDPTIGTLKKLSDGMNISLKELLIKANYMENDKGIKDEYLEVIKRLQEETIPAEDIKCFIEIIKNNRNSN